MLTVHGLDQDCHSIKAVENSLQKLIEIVIGICQQVLSLSGQTPATTGGDALDQVIQMEIIGRDDAYFKMVQFRNFVVHGYERVDNAVLVDVVNRRLMDFERFCDEMLAYVRRTIDAD